MSQNANRENSQIGADLSHVLKKFAKSLFKATRVDT